MKPPSRRTFLHASAALAGTTLLPDNASGEPDGRAYDEAHAVLYDATRCIGCRACGRECRKVNHLDCDNESLDGVAFDMPRELSPNDWMVLQAREVDTDEEEGAERWSFVKKNCMHCNVPACASACPVAALEKSENGPVLYFEDRCIGCRYCMLACPYHVPRYEWKDRMPRVRKCNLNGACVKACPVRALVDGKRRDLVAEAHRRIAQQSDRYVDHVYGEHEAGGTSYMVLSAMPLELFGFPKLPASVRSSYADAIMKGLPGWIIGLGLFLGGLHAMEKRQRQAAPPEENGS